MVSGARTIVRMAGIATAAAGLTIAGHSAAAAAGKCDPMQAQCAVEIGGTCDPKTGKWHYDNGVDRYNACVFRRLHEPKARPR
jgi:hypothetical protein